MIETTTKKSTGKPPLPFTCVVAVRRVRPTPTPDHDQGRGAGGKLLLQFVWPPRDGAGENTINDQSPRPVASRLVISDKCVPNGGWLLNRDCRGHVVWFIYPRLWPQTTPLLQLIKESWNRSRGVPLKMQYIGVITGNAAWGLYKIDYPKQSAAALNPLRERYWARGTTNFGRRRRNMELIEIKCLRVGLEYIWKTPHLNRTEPPPSWFKYSRYLHAGNSHLHLI